MRGEPFDPGLGVPALASSTATIRLDTQGCISDATVSAAAMLGFEPQDLRGRSLKDLALEGWQAAAEVAAARVRFGATDSFELALKGRSGRRTLVEMTARSTPNSAGGAVISWSERRLRRSGRPTDAEADLQRVAYGLLHAQEGERSRLAAGLNDEIAPSVVMAKYMIEDAVARLGPDAPSDSTKLLRDAALGLRGVFNELSRIATGLRPRLLDDLGLLRTLEWLCRGDGQPERAVRVECSLTLSESDVPQGLKLDILRIVQEALSNVVRARPRDACRGLAASRRRGAYLADRG